MKEMNLVPHFFSVELQHFASADFSENGPGDLLTQKILQLIKIEDLPKA